MFNDLRAQVERLKKSSGSGSSDLENKSITFPSDGSIVETSDSQAVTTVFNNDGSITETHAFTSGTTKQKNITFNADGSISETVTDVN